MNKDKILDYYYLETHEIDFKIQRMKDQEAYKDKENKKDKINLQKKEG